MSSQLGRSVEYRSEVPKRRLNLPPPQRHNSRYSVPCSFLAPAVYCCYCRLLLRAPSTHLPGDSRVLEISVIPHHLTSSPWTPPSPSSSPSPLMPPLRAARVDAVGSISHDWLIRMTILKNQSFEHFEIAVMSFVLLAFFFCIQSVSPFLFDFRLKALSRSHSDQHHHRVHFQAVDEICLWDCHHLPLIPTLSILPLDT